MYDPIKCRFRKITALTIAGILLVSGLTGCRKEKNPPEETTTAPPAVETTVPVQETTVPPTEPVLAKGTVTAEELNVRAGVGISYEVIGKLYQDDTVEVLEFADLNGVDWGRTPEGWICLVYVRMEGEPLHTPSETEAYELTGEITGTIIATELNIRTGPSTNYKVVKTLEKGEKLTISELDGIWGKTKDGWVNTIFVYFEGTMDNQKLQVKVNATTLNLRTGPSTAYESITKLAQKTELEIIKQVTIRDVNWGYTGEGWVCMKYVDIIA